MSARRRTRGTGSIYSRNGIWYGRLGKATPVELGPHGRGGLTKLQADHAWRDLLAADRRPGGETTIAELADLYLARLEEGNRKPFHIRTARSHLNTWIRLVLGDRAAVDVDERDVNQLVETMTLAGRSAKHVRNVGATLHSVLQIAVKREDIDRNPIDMADLPKVSDDPTLYFLTPDELDRVLAAAPGDDAPRPERDAWPTVRLFVLTAAMTGNRHGELDAMRWATSTLAPTRSALTAAGTPRRTRRHHEGKLVAGSCRCPAGCSQNSTPTTSAASTTRTTRWCSATRTPARRLRATICSNCSAAPATAPASAACAPTASRAGSRPAPHLRHHAGRQWRPAADDPGVLRPQACEHHRHLHRLAAGRARRRGCRRRIWWANVVTATTRRNMTLRKHRICGF